MKHILYGAGAIALLSIAAFFLMLTWTAHQVPAVLAREADATRAAAARQIEEARKNLLAKADAQITKARASILGEVRAWRKETHEQLNGIRADALDAVAMAAAPAGAAADSMEQLRQDLKPTLDHAASISKHLDDALPQFTDCAYLDESGEPVGGNPDCVFNRFQGTSKAIEKTSQSLAKMADAQAAAAQELVKQETGVAADVHGITTDFHTATTDFVKPKTLGQKFRMWLEVAGKIAARFL